MKTITRKELETILDSENKKPFQTKGIDHDMTALLLLREKIPYDVCRSIIGGAGHDQIYLCDVDDVLPYIDESDAKILADCNVFIDEENDSLSLFV